MIPALVAALIGCQGGPEGRRPRPEDLALDGFSSRLHDDLQTLIYAGWTQNVPATVHVEYTFEGDLWRSSPPRDFDAGAHEELLLGVPYDAAVAWRVVAEADGQTVTSPDQPAATGSGLGVPQGAVTISEPGQDPTEFFLISLALQRSYQDAWWTLIVDRQGRTVWALLAPYQRTSRQGRIAHDGRSLLLDRSSFFPTFDRGEASTIDQVLLDGTVTHSFAAPGLHHPFTDLPDGSVAYGRSVDWKPHDYTDEELVIVHPDGSTEGVWSCAAFLASIGSAERCMSNTLNYDVGTNRFLFSFFTSETVFEIDRGTGDVTRWFGHVPGAYAFDPPESEFWWQHGGHLTPTGTFLTSADLGPDHGTETVVREYEIDDTAATLREVWNFGVGDDIYGFQLGEAVRLPAGNTLQNFGQYARIREATPDKQVVWDLEWPADAVGHSLPIGSLVDLYDLAP